MTGLAVIEKGISKIKKYLNILQGYHKHTYEQIINDLTLRGAIERYLYLLVQSVLDLAEALISYKKLRRPATFTECFIILNEAKLIDKDLMQKMIKMAKFRNIITHDYEELDYEIVYDIFKNRIVDIENFINIIQDKLAD
ncbi:MAG: DUF86 domain-containing protein [Actinobacteria bacterium]|nr:DUF86 domain-containing protein [Actinomycetota bacterium]